MENHSAPLLEETCWSKVKDKVKQVNPYFAGMIDKIKPGKLPLYIARYPFGTTILNENNFYLPYNDKLLSIQDPQIPPELKAALDYNSGSVPLAIGLHNSVEL